MQKGKCSNRRCISFSFYNFFYVALRFSIFTRKTGTRRCMSGSSVVSRAPVISVSCHFLIEAALTRKCHDQSAKKFISSFLVVLSTTLHHVRMQSFQYWMPVLSGRE